MKFFVTYFVVLALTVICAVLSIIIPLGNVIGVGEGWYVIQSYVFIVGGVAALVLLLLEKREIKEVAGLNFRGHQVKASFLIMLLFLLLYVVRLLLSYLLEGQIREFGSLFADPSLYIMLPVLVINYFLSYIIFFRGRVWLALFPAARSAEKVRIKGRCPSAWCDLGIVASAGQSVLLQSGYVAAEHPDPDHCLYLLFCILWLCL
ncbi:MAG: hypothetical protein V8S42_04245 [Lachnospiraceae bacterium]